MRDARQLMAEQQHLEMDKLGPTVEFLGDVKADPKPEIEEFITSDGGRPSADQRRVHISSDPLAAELGADGETDIESVQSEEGWTAEGGRAGDVRKKRESAAIEDEYDTGILDRRATGHNPASSLSLKAKRPGDEARRSPLRIQPDSSGRPHINLCQVRYHIIVNTLPIHLILGLGRTL